MSKQVYNLFGDPEIIYQKEIPYLLRWVWRLPFGMSLRLHYFVDDESRKMYYHCHPWWFLSLVLWGWYKEARPFIPDKTRRIGSLVYRSRHDTHFISEVRDEGCWTLVLTGPKTKSWGFYRYHNWRDIIAEWDPEYQERRNK